MKYKRLALRYFLIYSFLFFVISCNTLCQKTEGKFCDVTPEEAHTLIQENSELVILDVRTKGEIASGMISNAIHIDYHDSNFREQVDQLDETIPYLVYCKAGSRSKNAQEIMYEIGFSAVYNLRGGFSAWKEEGCGYEIPK